MSVRLDQRILTPGLLVSVADLVAVFIDHYRPDEAMIACTACRFHYTDSALVCPSLAVVVPLLTRRRHEAPSVVPPWVREAVKGVKLPGPRRSLPVEMGGVELFDSAPYRVARVPRQRRSKRGLA